MANLQALFLELEAAVNAVEPRVLEGWKPGLTDEEIDALMATASFKLPDDLRALYRWKTPPGCGYSYLGALWMAVPFQASDEDFQYLRDEWREDWEWEHIPLPPDFDDLHFVPVFSDGGGSDLFACCAPRRIESCEIRHREKGGAGFSLMFRGVEPMIRTALEWWRNGVFHSPSEHRYGWELENDHKKEFEIGRRLNPGCDYWTS